MPKRIMNAKKLINDQLAAAQRELAETAGMGTSEFTKLALEVLDERSTDYIMKKSGTVIVITTPKAPGSALRAQECADRLVAAHRMCHGCDSQFECGLFEKWQDRWG